MHENELKCMNYRREVNACEFFHYFISHPTFSVRRIAYAFRFSHFLLYVLLVVLLCSTQRYDAVFAFLVFIFIRYLISYNLVIFPAFEYFGTRTHLCRDAEQLKAYQILILIFYVTI